MQVIVIIVQMEHAYHATLDISLLMVFVALEIALVVPRMFAAHAFLALAY